jgi:hypothetical protein
MVRAALVAVPRRGSQRARRERASHAGGDRAGAATNPPREGRQARELNLWLASLDKPICCLIGEDRVAAIWIEAGNPNATDAA